MKAIVQGLVSFGISYGLFKVFELAYDKCEAEYERRLRREYYKGYNEGLNKGFEEGKYFNTRTI